MSGIGEALAIVGCVAGLIQAYDAGSRIIRQIKTRRKAHGVPPPWTELEDSIEKGKREIASAVEDGTKRFGRDFIIGDTTAQLALYQITIATQNALLECLALARYDDEYNDFDDVIDSSDKGRIDALVALHELHQRRWEELLDRKKSEAARQAEMLKETTPVQLPIEKPLEKPVPSANSSRSRICSPVPQPVSEPQRKRGSIFSRAKGNDRKESVSSAGPSISATSLMRPVNSPPISRNHTDRTEVGVLPPKHKAPSVDASSLRSALSGETNCSGYSPVESPISSSPNISRTTTGLSTATTVVSITRYGGACKYAHLIREGGLKRGLELQNLSMTTVQLTYQCRSNKCKFRIPYDPETKKMDTQIRDCHGVQYRPAFLAKSHVGLDRVTPHFPFLCLICMMLKNDSQTYNGREELFSHIIEHRERTLGGTPLEGPLIFSNNSVIMGADFDINLPEFTSLPSTPTPEAETPASKATDLEIVLEKLQGQIHTPSSTPKQRNVVTVMVHNNPNSPDYNPWA